MDTFLKPAIYSTEQLYFSPADFCLALSLHAGRERLLPLRDPMRDPEFTRDLAADLGFKVQRELRQGRDVFVFRGRLLRDEAGHTSAFVTQVDLHVRPTVAGATGRLTGTPRLHGRLQGMIDAAVRWILGRLGVPCALDPAQETVDQGTSDVSAVTGETPGADFIDPQWLTLEPVSLFSQERFGNPPRPAPTTSR